MASLNQPSFAAGELSPELRRRIDLQKYAIGAEEIKNMIVLPRGGVQSRPGTVFVSEIKDSGKRVCLVDFVFSTEQPYLLEFGHQYIRFYKDGGVIVSGASPYEVATTYQESELADLKFEQSADTLYISHPSHAPRMLTRTEHAAWVLSAYENINGPLRAENDTNVTLTVTKTSSPATEVLLKGDAVTLTASSSTFQAGHVGGLFGIRHKQCEKHYSAYCPQNIAFYSAAFPVQGEWVVMIDPRAGDFNQADAYVERSRDGGATWTKIKTVLQSGTNDVEVSGSEEDSVLIRVTRPTVTDDSFNISVDSTGKFEWACVKITEYVSATVVKGTLLKDFDQGAAAFKTWAEGSWSSVRGWPACVGFYQNRLCFGRTVQEPNAFWDSKTGDYANFDVSFPALDDDAINSRLLGRMVNAIHHMVPLQSQVFLTSDSEWVVKPSIQGQFTPSGIKIEQLTYYGASQSVEPVIIGDSAVYVVRGGGSVRSISYDDVAGKVSSDLSVMASHLFSGRTVIDWAYQQMPYYALWCVMSDGALLSFTYHKEHEVWAWCRHESQGAFEAVACIPGVDQDEVYFIVKRTIGGATKRYVETLAHRDAGSAADFFGVDCGLTYSGAPTATISGLSHLEGKAVAVLADGVEVSGLSVASGSITLPRAASLVHIGLAYEWRLRTLQIDASNKNTGYSSDKKKLIPGATISVLNSYGGLSGEDQFVILPWSSPSTAPVLESGDINVELLSGWRKEGQFEIKGSGIYPMHITNLMPRVQVGGN